MSSKQVYIVLVALLVWFFYDKNQPKERVLTTEEQIVQNFIDFKNKKESSRAQPQQNWKSHLKKRLL